MERLKDERMENDGRMDAWRAGKWDGKRESSMTSRKEGWKTGKQHGREENGMECGMGSGSN